MKASTERILVRTIHLIFTIPIFGYIFSPFDKLPEYAFRTRFIFFPIMVLTGLWMWKGYLVKRLFTRRAPASRSAA